MCFSVGWKNNPLIREITFVHIKINVYELTVKVKS